MRSDNEWTGRVPKSLPAVSHRDVEAFSLNPSYRSVIAAAPVAPSGAGAYRSAHTGQTEAPAAAWLDIRPAAAAASIIGVFLSVRLVLMLAVGFGNDEAYTLAGARTLRLSYFDHPPLHIWLAHLTSLLVGETLWVRLPFVLLFAATGWLLFLVTRHLYDPRAAVWSVLALNLSIFFTVSAGGWVVPDGVLIFCLLAAVLALLPVLVPKAGSEATSVWRPWLLAGLWFGLAGLSKYNAVLIALGLVAFVVASPRHRRWLAHPAPYVGALAALVVLLPVLLWNAGNGWASIAFQTSRGLPRSALHPVQVLSMLAGEAALLSPWVVVPLVASVVAACRAPRRDADRLMLALSLPIIILFSIAPLWSARGLPHWPMPGWLFVFPLLGAWIETDRRRWFAPTRWAVVSTTAFGAVLVVAVGLTAEGWASHDMAASGAGLDPTLESLDWSALRSADAVIGTRPAFVVTARWMDAGKIALALGRNVQVAVFSDDPRQFAFGPSVDRFVGQDALVILPTTVLAEQLPRLRPYFAALDRPEHLWLGRHDRDEIELAIVRAHGLLRPYPLPYGGGPSATAPIRVKL